MKQVSSRAFTIAYATALTIIASLSIICHSIVAHDLQRGEQSSALINVSGKQRMFSQRMASMAAQLMLGDQGARAGLQAATDAFEAEHILLVRHVETADPRTSETRMLRGIYFNGANSLDAQTRTYIATARRILAAQPGDPALPDLSQALFRQSDTTLLRALDQVVTVRQQDAEGHVAKLKRLQFGIVAIVLLTLIVEALTIFRPLVSRIVRYTAALAHLATTDFLTGAANRRGFLDQSARELSRARRSERPLSLLMLDVDHFKRINDTHGHAAGDEVLTSLAATLKQALRVTDVLGRVGGEEFAILMPDTGLDAAAYVAERIRLAVSDAEISFGAATLRMTVSVGVAQASPAVKAIDQVMDDADRNLYRAKQIGRNCVVAARDTTWAASVEADSNAATPTRGPALLA